MDLKFERARAPLRGTLEMPGDKSLAHRAALFAALAGGESAIARFPDSGVTRAMRNALAALGVPSSLDDGTLRLSGTAGRPFPAAGATAFCGNSGTTMRMLAGALAMTGTGARMDGSAGLRRRPMERIAAPLREMGAEISTAPGGTAPIDVAARPDGRPLSPFDGSIPVASAQVKSCIALAALGASGPSTIREPGPSRDHTERMLRHMGACVRAAPEAGPHAIRVEPLERPLAPLRISLPGDISSAAFALAAAAIVPGSEVAVSGVRDCAGEPVGDVLLRARPLKAIDVSGGMVVRAIDEFPAIAAVAAFAEGVTTVRDAAELRGKESDRIAAIVRNLRALGAEAEESPDGFSVRGGTLRGGVAEAGGDHRLAMSMAVAGLAAPEGVTVRNAEILSESYPSFAADIRSLAVR